MFLAHLLHLFIYLFFPFSLMAILEYGRQFSSQREKCHCCLEEHFCAEIRRRPHIYSSNLKKSKVKVKTQKNLEMLDERNRVPLVSICRLTNTARFHFFPESFCRQQTKGTSRCRCRPPCFFLFSFFLSSSLII